MIYWTGPPTGIATAVIKSGPPRSNITVRRGIRATAKGQHQIIVVTRHIVTLTVHLTRLLYTTHAGKP